MQPKMPIMLRLDKPVLVAVSFSHPPACGFIGGAGQSRGSDRAGWQPSVTGISLGSVCWIVYLVQCQDRAGFYGADEQGMVSTHQDQAPGLGEQMIPYPSPRSVYTTILGLMGHVSSAPFCG